VRRHDAPGCDVTTPPDAAAYDTAGYDLGLPPADTSAATDTAATDTSTTPDSTADSGAPDTVVEDTSVVIVDSAVEDTTTADTASADSVAPDTAIADDANVAAPVFDGGTPTLPASVQRCSRDEECSTGHCADGVCCDTACGERCHSCATLDAPGKCTVLPAGVDLRGECGPVGTCVATCDGKGSCVGAGSGTQCAQQRCTGKSKGVGPAYCSGRGAPCPLNESVVAFECAPYVCEPLFGACTSSCTNTAECASGHVCDGTSKQCVPIPPPPDDDGGCSISATRSGNASRSLWLLLGAIYWLARRRRSAAPRDSALG
jgi:hypothetical protein